MTHLDLSDEQTHVLVELYADMAGSLDDLPYTEGFERLYDNFLAKTGLMIEWHYVWRALCNCRKAGKLARKER